MIIYMTVYQRQNHSDGEQISGCQGLEVGGGMTTVGEHSTKDVFGGDRTVVHPDFGGGYSNLYMD